MKGYWVIVYIVSFLFCFGAAMMILFDYYHPSLQTIGVIAFIALGNTFADFANRNAEKYKNEQK